MTKALKIPFSQWKEKSRKFTGLDVHVSMDGNTEKVIVTPLKK